MLVSVGLAPASRQDLARQPGTPVDGIGDAARTDDTADYTEVTFLKGTTLVQLRANKLKDGTDRKAQVAAVAGEIARRVPADPPETDEQTDGICGRVDPAAVRDVLGEDPGVSRSFTYATGSATCSWATGAVDAKEVSVAVYTNSYAGPFLADCAAYEPTADVPGDGDAFTIPGVAYADRRGRPGRVGPRHLPAARRSPHPAARHAAAQGAARRARSRCCGRHPLDERRERRRRQRPGVPVAGLLVAVPRSPPGSPRCPPYPRTRRRPAGPRPARRAR